MSQISDQAVLGLEHILAAARYNHDFVSSPLHFSSLTFIIGIYTYLIFRYFQSFNSKRTKAIQTRNFTSSSFHWFDSAFKTSVLASWLRRHATPTLPLPWIYIEWGWFPANTLLSSSFCFVCWRRISPIILSYCIHPFSKSGSRGICRVLLPVSSWFQGAGLDGCTFTKSKLCSFLDVRPATFSARLREREHHPQS